MISPRIWPILAAQPVANRHGFQTTRVHDKGMSASQKTWRRRNLKFPDADGSVDVLTCRYCAVEIDVLIRKILGLIK